jgi:hypothetical protein
VRDATFAGCTTMGGRLTARDIEAGWTVPRQDDFHGEAAMAALVAVDPSPGVSMSEKGALFPLPAAVHYLCPR